MVYQIATGDVVAGRMIKVPQIFIPRVIRAVIIGLTPAQTQVLNVIHVLSANDPITQLDVVTLAEIISGWVTTAYTTIVSEKIRFTDIHVRAMTGLVVPAYTISLTGFTGTMAGECMPYQVSYPVELTTGLTGRANRGMFYVMPASENANDANGNPTIGYTASCKEMLGQLLVDLNTYDYPLVVAKFQSASTQAVTTATGKGVWGNQMRRRIGNGR
jgi:hypothetical protein